MENSEAIKTMLVICGYGVCLFMGLLCALLLYKIWVGEINLNTMLAEANGDASISRFQLLVFTLMIAISVFIIVEKTGQLPPVPDGILTLLGISASTYAVGKGISFSRPEGVTKPPSRTETVEAMKHVADKGGAVVDAEQNIGAAGK